MSMNLREKAIETAKLLQSEGIYLSTKPSTPLDELYQLGKEVVYEGEDISLENITPATGEIIDNVNLYKVRLEQIKNINVKAITSQIVFAKTKVLPIIKKVSEELIKKVEEKISSKETDIVISEENLPLPLRTELFVDLISEDIEFGSAHLDFDKIILNLSNEEIDKINILDLVKTHNLILDEAFESFIKDNNLVVVLSDVFKSLFKNTDGFHLNKLSPKNLLSNDEAIYNRIKYAVMYYYISLALENNPIDGILGDQKDYELFLRNLRLKSADIFQYGLKQFENYITSNTLIVDVIDKLDNKDKKTIIKVIGPVYEKFKSSGGTDIALYGLFYKEGKEAKYFNLDSILNELLDLTESYESRIRLITETNKRDEVFITKTTLRDILEDLSEELYIKNGLNEYLVENTFSEEIYKTYKNPIYLETLNKIRELIIDSKDYEVKDMVSFVTYVVCKGMFEKTASYDILKGMDVVETLNSDITNPREAAFVSVLSYVNSFMFKQLEIK